MLQAPKGTRDLVGSEVHSFFRLEQAARRIFDLYQFSEIRTPIFESLDLFSRSLGATSDVVEKEMFSFSDRGEREFALRPEGTAGVVRHYIENKLSVKGGQPRFFYVGPMFRAERPQAGRYRQFWQIGSEHFGESEPTADADTVLMIAQLLTGFGLTDFKIQVNSLGCKTCRAAYRTALLSYLKAKESLLGEESKRRMNVNPLRVLDSKADGPKLMDAPVMKDHLCAACGDHYKSFLSLIKEAPFKIVENPRLVRGLDYYTRTVFEFVSDELGAQNALAAGGRYDDLVELLGGPPTPAVGFALGMDRVCSIEKLTAQDGLKQTTPRAMVIPLLEAAVPWAFELSQRLRMKGVAIPPILPKKKLKNQLSMASDQGVKWALLLGEDELKSNEVTLKNLESRDQSRLSENKLIEQLTN